MISPPLAAPAGNRLLPVEMSGTATTYANFVRVTGTPEELVFDLGLNTQIDSNPAEPIKITNRVVMNFYTVAFAAAIWTLANAAERYPERAKSAG